VLLVAENAVVAQNHILLNGLLVTKFHTAGKLSQLLLSNRGHDGQPKLRILVEGVDVVVLKEYAYATTQKLTGVLNGIQGVAGETGDLLGDDKIKLVLCRILDHAVKILALLGGDAGKTFIDITRNKSPVLVSLDKILIVCDLVAERVQLLIAFGRNAGIVSHPQGNIVYRFGL